MYSFKRHRFLVDKKLESSQQCAFAVQKANHTLDLIKRSVTSRSKEVILPLCYILMKTHLENHAAVWGRGKTWPVEAEPEQGHKGSLL